MGWGVLGELLDTDKVVDNILDKDNGLLAKAGAWIGNLNLTDEDVMENNIKTVQHVQDFVVATLDENTERSRSRRSIATLWIKVQLAIILFCCLAAPWNMELAKFYFELATSTLMVTVTTAVCIFFFGSHGITRIQSGKK